MSSREGVNRHFLTFKLNNGDVRHPYEYWSIHDFQETQIKVQIPYETSTQYIKREVWGLIDYFSAKQNDYTQEYRITTHPVKNAVSMHASCICRFMLHNSKLANFQLQHQRWNIFFLEFSLSLCMNIKYQGTDSDTWCLVCW